MFLQVSFKATLRRKKNVLCIVTWLKLTKLTPTHCSLCTDTTKGALDSSLMTVTRAVSTLNLVVVLWWQYSGRTGVEVSWVETKAVARANSSTGKKRCLSMRGKSVISLHLIKKHRGNVFYKNVYT